MTEIQKLLYTELYKRSLYDFVKDFWVTCDPSKFIDGKLVKFYCEVFEYFSRSWTNLEISDVEKIPLSEEYDVIDVRENKHNLCLNVPPRHTKSMIFNVFGPVWIWLSSPIKAVSISHTANLSTSMNNKRYRIINSSKFQELFGNKINLTTNTKSMLIDNRGGELYSINRNAFTGYGGDIIINDDITSAETARKDMVEMENAWSYYQNTMPSRINDINKCFIMNVQQRLAPNDITGHIKNDTSLSSQYTFVTLPAIFEKTTYVICPISGEILKWEKGEGLWKERFGNYDSLRLQVGESIFETQYLQNPIATDKTIIKKELINEISYLDAPKMEDADMVYASHDFPVKDKENSDFLGSVLAYRVDGNLYITDCLEKKMGFVKSVEYVRQLDTLFPGIIQIIENKANGSPILQQLQDEISGMQAFQPGTNSKTQRLESASLYMSSGNVKFVKTEFNEKTNTYNFSKNMNNLITRLLNFPFVKHDDIIDALTQCILFVFMDKRYAVYGRSFNEYNIIDTSNIFVQEKTVFFNKEGDIWKAIQIGINYSSNSKLYVLKEIKFKASISDGIKKLLEFAFPRKILIDCSKTDGLYGMREGAIIERYEDDDFDRSVGQLNLNFAKKKILIDKNCHLIKGDIENVKFSKSNDENFKYASEKDGFVACLRLAIKFYGGLN